MAVNNWQLTRDAVAGTLLDLATRGVFRFRQDPDQLVILTPPSVPDGLRRYERLLVRHVLAQARDGEVAADALAADNNVVSSAAFYDAFEDAVLAEAKTRDLVTKRLTETSTFGLLALSVLPAGLAAAALIETGFSTGLWVLSWGVLAGLIMFALRGPKYRAGPAGPAVLAHWLGYRQALGADDEVSRVRPTEIDAWGRHLAYAAALGLAEVTLWLLPIGVNDPQTAWVRDGERWRKLRIWYPRLLGWGHRPVDQLGSGALKLAVGAGLVVMSLVWGTGTVDLTELFLTAGIVLTAWGVTDFVLVAVERRTCREHFGVIVRRKADKGHFYLALLDHNAPENAERVKAYRILPVTVPPAAIQNFSEGTEVGITAGRGLGHVIHVSILPPGTVGQLAHGQESSSYS